MVLRTCPRVQGKCISFYVSKYGSFVRTLLFSRVFGSFFLTIRRGNSYLQRKTASHAREPDLLDGSMALQMCHYNFIRPHSALRFGKETRTPAMQAGIVSKKLSFRDIFTSREVLFLCLIFWVLIQRKKLIHSARCSRLTTVA